MGKKLLPSSYYLFPSCPSSVPLSYPSPPCLLSLSLVLLPALPFLHDIPGYLQPGQQRDECGPTAGVSQAVQRLTQQERQSESGREEVGMGGSEEEEKEFLL